MRLYKDADKSYHFNEKLYGVKSNLNIKNSSNDEHLKTQSLQNKSKKRNKTDESRIELTAVPPWPTESHPNVEDLRKKSQMYSGSSSMINSEIISRMTVRECATRKQQLEVRINCMKFLKQNLKLIYNRKNFFTI